MFLYRNVVIYYIVGNVSADHPTNRELTTSKPKGNGQTRASQEDLAIGSYIAKTLAPELKNCIDSVILNLRHPGDGGVKASVKINGEYYFLSQYLYEFTDEKAVKTIPDYKKCYWFFKGFSTGGDYRKKLFEKCGLVYDAARNRAILCVPKKPEELGQLHLYLGGDRKRKSLVDSLNLLITLAPQSTISTVDQDTGHSAVASAADSKIINDVPLRPSPSREYVSAPKRRRVDEEETKEPIKDGVYRGVLNQASDVAAYIQTSSDGQQLLNVDLVRNGEYKRVLENRILRKDDLNPGHFKVDGTSALIKHDATRPGSLVLDFGQGVKWLLDPVDLGEVVQFFSGAGIN